VVIFPDSTSLWVTIYFAELLHTSFNKVQLSLHLRYISTNTHLDVKTSPRITWYKIGKYSALFQVREKFMVQKRQEFCLLSSKVHYRGSHPSLDVMSDGP
jgi:hypothetical protein